LLRDAGDRRLALLVNDFGAINIDAELVQSRDGQMVSLKNGCICCGGGGGLSGGGARPADPAAPPPPGGGGGAPAAAGGGPRGIIQ
jgi:hypothetical protein